MDKRNSSSTAAEDWILLGIPVIFTVGSVMHFVYGWSGMLPIVGFFAPVNESVWEHLKMAFWPMLVWWFLGYAVLFRKEALRASQWFTSCAAAEITCLLVILSFYYLYTGALGIESLALDIFAFFLGIAAGQLLGLHVYKHACSNRFYLYASFFILFLLAFAFIAFTYDPPELPLFQVG